MNEPDLFLYLSLSFITGIFISSLMYQWGLLLFSLVLIIAIFFLLILIYFFWKKAVIYFVFILFFCFGGLWAQHYLSIIDKSQLVDMALGAEEFKSWGLIDQEIEDRITYRLVRVRIENKGIIEFRYNKNDLQYGDLVEVSGQLSAIKNFSDFNYQRYLNKQGILAQLNKPKVKIIARHRGSFIYENILSLRQKMRSFAKNNFSQSDYAIVCALILGDTQFLSQDFKNNLSDSGLSHIVAISGMHIVLLEAMIFSLLLSLGLNRKKALWVDLLIIIFYVFLSGLKVSAIRAAIMGSFFIVAKILGHIPNTWRALIISASLMLAINPMLVFFDLSFQLSFLAVLGLVLYFEYFNDRLWFIPEIGAFNLRSNLATTMAALLLTWPIISSVFGKISLIALFSNLLILPLSGLMVLFGLLSLFIGSVVPVLGFILALPLFCLLPYFAWVVNWSAQVDLLQFQYQLNGLSLVVYYFLMMIFAKHVRKQLDFLL